MMAIVVLVVVVRWSKEWVGGGNNVITCAIAALLVRARK
jgi:hypothetical protein